MSETKIVSLKDPQKRIYASIVPTKDGKWMEIKDNYEFQSKKRIFASEEEWLSKMKHAFRYICCEVVRNEREPRIPIEEKWRKHRIDSSLKDCAYLKAIKEKYRIRTWAPSKIYNLMDKAMDIKHSIAWLTSDLERPLTSTHLENIQRMLELKKEQYRMLQVEIEGMTFQDEYKPLTRKTTLAYIQQGDSLVAIGYDSEKNRIVFDGRGATTFHDLDLPDRPDLWVWKKNKMIRVY